MNGSSSITSSRAYYENGRVYKDAYDRMMGNTTKCTRVINVFGNSILFAILIIGCIAAAQMLPGSLTGWSVAGGGGSYMAMKLLPGNAKNRQIDLISSGVLAFSIITFGVLGGAAVLTNVQMGSALIGVVALTALMSSGAMIFAKRREEKNKRDRLCHQ